MSQSNQQDFEDDGFEIVTMPLNTDHGVADHGVADHGVADAADDEDFQSNSVPSKNSSNSNDNDDDVNCSPSSGGGILSLINDSDIMSALRSSTSALRSSPSYEDRERPDFTLPEHRELTSVNPRSEFHINQMKMRKISNQSDENNAFSSDDNTGDCINDDTDLFDRIKSKVSPSFYQLDFSFPQYDLDYSEDDPDNASFEPNSTAFKETPAASDSSENESGSSPDISKIFDINHPNTDHFTASFASAEDLNRPFVSKLTTNLVGNLLLTSRPHPNPVFSIACDHHIFEGTPSRDHCYDTYKSAQFAENWFDSLWLDTMVSVDSLINREKDSSPITDWFDHIWDGAMDSLKNKQNIADGGQNTGAEMAASSTWFDNVFNSAISEIGLQTDAQNSEKSHLQKTLQIPGHESKHIPHPMYDQFSKPVPNTHKVYDRIPSPARSFTEISQRSPVTERVLRPKSTSTSCQSEREEENRRRPTSDTAAPLREAYHHRVSFKDYDENATQVDIELLVDDSSTTDDISGSDDKQELLDFGSKKLSDLQLEDEEKQQFTVEPQEGVDSVDDAVLLNEIGKTKSKRKGCPCLPLPKFKSKHRSSKPKTNKK